MRDAGWDQAAALSPVAASAFPAEGAAGPGAAGAGPGAGDAATAGGSLPRTAAEARALLAAALGHLGHRAAGGDGLAAAALRLAPPHAGAGEAFAAAPGLAAPGAAPDAEDGAAAEAGPAPSFYALALAASDAGRREDAIGFLLAALAHPTDEADGCLGLAGYALAAGAAADAGLLAARCLELGARHPRACLILGLAEQAAGRREGAQRYLAAAARIARRDPRLRSDLEGAQRALLTMQLSPGR